MLLHFQPSINIGGSSTPGGVAVEIIAGGIAVGKVELYNLHQPLPGSHQNGPGYIAPDGTYRETLGRPTADSVRRRRSASVASNMDYEIDNHGVPEVPLFNRIQPTRSTASTPVPGLIRSDVTVSSDGFAIPQPRPQSRMSNNGAAGGWGNQNFVHNQQQQQGHRFRPYSSNSNRSYGANSNFSNGMNVRRSRDSYYPQYENKKVVGEYFE